MASSKALLVSRLHASTISHWKSALHLPRENGKLREAQTALRLLSACHTALGIPLLSCLLAASVETVRRRRTQYLAHSREKGRERCEKVLEQAHPTEKGLSLTHSLSLSLSLSISISLSPSLFLSLFLLLKIRQACTTARDLSLAEPVGLPMLIFSRNRSVASRSILNDGVGRKTNPVARQKQEHCKLPISRFLLKKHLRAPSRRCQAFDKTDARMKPSQECQPAGDTRSCHARMPCTSPRRGSAPCINTLHPPPSVLLLPPPVSRKHHAQNNQIKTRSTCANLADMSNCKEDRLIFTLPPSAPRRNLGRPKHSRTTQSRPQLK